MVDRAATVVTLGALLAASIERDWGEWMVAIFTLMLAITVLLIWTPPMRVEVQKKNERHNEDGS